MRVLLIQPGWPARALLKAELEERGFEVLGADSLGLALELAMKRGFRPDVMVVDAVGLDITEAEARRLRFLRGSAPLLLIRSGQYEVPDVALLSPTEELARPLAVGEIADAVALHVGLSGK